MELFKKIFDNNSRELVEKFFKHPFVMKIWPTMMRHFTKEIVFGAKKPNQEIEMTYREITRQIT